MVVVVVEVVVVVVIVAVGVDDSLNVVKVEDASMYSNNCSMSVVIV